MPGGIAGWTDLAPRIRLHEWVPHAAVGEVAAGGLLCVLVYFALVAFMLGGLDVAICLYLGSGGRVARAILNAFSFAFAVLSLQYNLRSATRMVYYAVLLAGFLAGVEYFLTRYRIRFVLTRGA